MTTRMSSYSLLGCALWLSLAGCSKKEDPAVAENIKLCAAAPTLVISSAKGTSEQAYNTILIDSLKACSAACDGKDTASCAVLEKNANTWFSLASYEPIKQLRTGSKSASLARELCDVVNEKPAK